MITYYGKIKIVVLILFITMSLTATSYLLVYNQYQHLTIENLKNDAKVVYQYVEDILDDDNFTELSTEKDESKEVYIKTQHELQQVRQIANIRYLYTAKRNDDGEYIYVVDGLDQNVDDFYHVGTPIEDEIVSDLSKCLNDESVMGDEIKVTDWRIVFVTYFPVHAEDGTVLGAVGMEFDCENLYDSFAVEDTGIGMSQEQLKKLFKSFGQADESITRRFGGTGLGLAISKSIVEKMNGRIWAESEVDKGSRFIFEIQMERLTSKDETLIFSEITPSDLKILVVDADKEILQRFTAVTDRFGIHTYHDIFLGME